VQSGVAEDLDLHGVTVYDATEVVAGGREHRWQDDPWITHFSLIPEAA
jgi:hypothetical protein